MDEAALAVVIGVIPAAATLVVSILLYWLAFRKKNRMRANTYSWLITTGFALVLEIILSQIFEAEVGIQFVPVGVYAPILGIMISSFWALIRFIAIKVTPNRERTFVQKTPEPALG